MKKYLIYNTIGHFVGPLLSFPRFGTTLVTIQFCHVLFWFDLFFLIYNKVQPYKN
jgi:hypothetical protein